MLLIIEILLTIKAYKNGWRAWAIMPPAIGLIAGMAIGASQYGANLGPFAYLPLDLLLIVVLGIMTAVAPKKAEDKTPESLPAPAVEQSASSPVVS